MNSAPPYRIHSPACSPFLFTGLSFKKKAKKREKPESAEANKKELVWSQVLASPPISWPRPCLTYMGLG